MNYHVNDKVNWRGKQYQVMEVYRPQRSLDPFGIRLAGHGRVFDVEAGALDCHNVTRQLHHCFCGEPAEANDTTIQCSDTECLYREPVSHQYWQSLPNCEACLDLTMVNKANDTWKERTEKAEKERDNERTATVQYLRRLARTKRKSASDYSDADPEGTAALWAEASNLEYVANVIEAGEHVR